MGRSDNYRFGLLAHPGRSKGAARYDVGLLAHRHSRPALTETSPTGSPYPELPSLPSPDLPVQQPLAAHRHTRYDAFGRIKNHRWKDSGGTLIAGWHHDYDRVGNKKYSEDLKDSTESELYAYDAVYRLDEFDRGQLNQAKDDISSPTRTLDPLGNWDQTVLDGTTESRTHNDVNELTQRTIGQNPSISLTYDDAGNLTQDGDSDGDHKYTWDYRNRLIEVEEKQSGNWNTVAEYKYDGRTRRVLKVVTNKGDLNGTTRFVWGGNSDWQCLEERDGSGNLVARFTYAPGYIDAVARQERDLNSDDDFADDDEVVWYHSSTLYTVYALTDASENVVERYRYDAYGAWTVLDSDFSSDADGASDVENPYAFTARRRDTESGLMQYRHRYYVLDLGRFVSRDPTEYSSGFSLYCYANTKPTSLADSLGLMGHFPPTPPEIHPPDDDGDEDECEDEDCEEECDDWQFDFAAPSKSRVINQNDNYFPFRWATRTICFWGRRCRRVCDGKVVKRWGEFTTAERGFIGAQCAKVPGGFSKQTMYDGWVRFKGWWHMRAWPPDGRGHVEAQNACIGHPPDDDINGEQGDENERAEQPD